MVGFAVCLVVEAVWAGVIQELNFKYLQVSGEETPLYGEISEVYRDYNTTVPCSVLLVNNSLTGSLELHYFEYGSPNATTMVSHVSPRYTDNPNYDLEGIRSIIQKEFKIKGKNIGVIEEKEMEIQIGSSEKIKIRLCEAIAFVDSSLYKVYALTQPQNVSFYAWKYMEDYQYKVSKLRLSYIASFLLGVVLTTCAVYMYYNTKKHIPFVKLQEASS